MGDQHQHLLVLLVEIAFQLVQSLNHTQTKERKRGEREGRGEEREGK
jgi:hypothetical protein